MSVDTQMKEVVQESREWVEDQIEELSKQVKQLQKRSRKQVNQRFLLRLLISSLIAMARI